MPPTAPEGFEIITEGKASIIFSKENTVFYNKVQVFNRDLSILAIRTFAQRRQKEFEAAAEKKREKALKHIERLKQKQEENKETTITIPSPPEEVKWNGISIFEALSATGLRSLRYQMEIPNVKHITVNDISADAVDAIKKNIEFNKAPTSILKANHGDANVVMLLARGEKKTFDVVDLDPYGSASIFLDAAVQGVAEGGLMCITCTDKAVLCGNNSETCYSKYGCMPLKGAWCADQAVRIVLACAERMANRHKRYLVPLLSMSIDFYVRVFVRVYTSPATVKRSANKMTRVYQCNQCGSVHTASVGKITEKTTAKGGLSVKYAPGMSPEIDSRCAECGGRFKIGGPIWGAPIHDPSFIDEMLGEVEKDSSTFATKPRIVGQLNVCKQELSGPLFYDISSMCHVLKATTPPAIRIRSALVHAGYKVSQTHCSSSGLKSDAPYSVVWDILRCQVKEVPLKKKSQEGSAAEKILQKEPKLEANFTTLRHLNWASKVTGQPRFFQNPEKNWGPLGRAKPKLDGKKGGGEANAEKRKLSAHEQLQARSRENQGKKKQKTKAAVENEAKTE